MSRAISVIIVTYNSEDSIEKCLTNIPRSVGTLSFEVIVVDNLSQDSTLEIVRKFDFVKVIENSSNLGFASACNIGARRACGTNLLFLNPDAYVLNNAIESLAKYEVESGRGAIIGGKVIEPDGKDTLSIRSFPTLLNVFSEASFLYRLFPRSAKFGSYYYTTLDRERAIRVDAVEGSFMLIPKTAFYELKGFDGDYFLYSEDTDLCYRAMEKGIPVVYFPAAIAVHIGQGSSGTVSRRYVLSMHLAQIKFIRHHFSGYKRLGMLFIKVIGLFLRVPLYLVMAVVTMRTSLLKKSFYYLETAVRGVFAGDVPKSLRD